MWKVLVVICTLEHPCTMFEEDPMKYYQSEQERWRIADEKANAMVRDFSANGYTIESAASTCEMEYSQGSA